MSNRSTAAATVRATTSARSGSSPCRPPSTSSRRWGAGMSSSAACISSGVPNGSGRRVRTATDYADPVGVRCAASPVCRASAADTTAAQARRDVGALGGEHRRLASAVRVPGKDQWTVGEVADRVGRGDDALAVLSGPGLVRRARRPTPAERQVVAQYQEAPFGEADGHGLQEFCVEVAARAVREDEFADRVAGRTVQVSVHVVGVEEDRFVERTHDCRGYRGVMSRLRVLVTGATGYIGGRLAPVCSPPDTMFGCWRVLPRSCGTSRGRNRWRSCAAISRTPSRWPPRPPTWTSCTSWCTPWATPRSSWKRSGAARPTWRRPRRRAASDASSTGWIAPGGHRPLAAHALPRAGGPDTHGVGGSDDGAAGRRRHRFGSASFEMIRHLTNRLPVMTTPKWVNNRIQPIAVRDVLYYLVAAATAPLPRSRTFDIGGPDVLTYGGRHDEGVCGGGGSAAASGAGAAGAHTAPGGSVDRTGDTHPQLAGRALIESLHKTTRRHRPRHRRRHPTARGGADAVPPAWQLALRRIKNGEVETNWANASPVGAPSIRCRPIPTGRERWSSPMSAAPSATRMPTRCGGCSRASACENGWYSFPLAW